MKSLHIGDLKIPVPIIQGGMGIGISMSGLASAVSGMGGVGVISTVGIGLIHHNPAFNFKKNNIEALRKEIRRARKLSTGVLGVNIMSVITNFSDLVKTSIEEGIDIIFSGAGLPLDLPKYLEDGIKTKLVPIVSSARAVSIICNKWMQNFNYLPDAVVVEGPKAGGHLGYKAADLEDKKFELEKLVPQIVEVTREMREKYNKEIPVIAAGGIYSGADMFKIMQKGASAVQLGTRFVATKECDASDAFKNAIVNAKIEDVQIIQSPVGMPGRAVKNAFLAEATKGWRKPAFCKNNCIKSCNPKTTAYCISEALLQAYKGNLDDGFAFTGTNAWKVKKITTVKEIFNDLISGYKTASKQHKNKMSCAN